MAASFDYGDMDSATRGKLVCIAGTFNRKMSEYKKSWLELGEAVSEAHSLLAGSGRDGKFSKWVESELSVSKKTAYRYKLSWDRFGNKRDTLSHFSTEAIYLLAGTTVPDNAVRDAIKMAERGDKVNKDVASELIEKHTLEPVVQQAAAVESVQVPAITDEQSDDPYECAPGEHEWEADRDGTYCAKCKIDKPEEQPAVPDADDEPVAKLFSELLEHQRLSMLLLDRINRAAPSQKHWQAIYDSLNCAHLDTHDWRKLSKKKR